MELYHGSYLPIEAPSIISGKFAKDFGTGFYCTEIKSQAEKWAKRYDTSTISIYDYNENSTLNILAFDEMSEEWLDFIVDCRKGLPHNYDIVSGAMANDQIYNYISDFINGVLTREQFWILAKFKYPTHQINFCSERALQYLFYKGSEVLK